jgi:hypothetical protein
MLVRRTEDIWTRVVRNVETSIQLHAGDRFVVYADHLAEVRNYERELFSFDRLQALLATGADANQATDATQRLVRMATLPSRALRKMAPAQSFPRVLGHYRSPREVGLRFEPDN